MPNLLGKRYTPIELDYAKNTNIYRERKSLILSRNSHCHVRNELGELCKQQHCKRNS